MNIDGDLCHRVQNAVKKFCKPFEKHLVNLWRDIHNDIKFSADIKAALQELCLLLDLPYKKPSEAVPHRWLSAYNVTTNNMPMYDALFLLYYSWMNKEDQAIYRDDKDLIFEQNGCTEKAKESILLIQKQMKKKGLTKKGKDSKSRIYEKVIFQKHETLLIANFYEAVLPMFKSFILVFEQKTPQVHKLHLKLSEVTRDFFTYILKCESIKGLAGSKLKKVNIKNELRITKDFFVGASNEKLTRKLRHENKADIVKEFQVCDKKAFINTAIYMQEKFPLTNKFLMCLSGLDPTAIGHSASYACLKKFADFFPTILTTTEKTNNYLKEISTLQFDESLPYALEENGVPVQLDLWWGKIFQTSNYPVLSQVFKACLSIFSGSHVESSFSLMSNIIDK